MTDAGTGDARKEAVKQIKRKRLFQQQLLVFVIINVFLWIVWAVTGTGFPWPIFVTVGWGIGIALQAWTIYGVSRPITEADIKREMGDDQGTP
jgi:hypothetical protein